MISRIVLQANRFHRKASLETDMAKRIMLSIIPAVMTQTERSSTMIDPKYWGLDYKALRSAVMGAKELIRYGALICVDELKHYGDPILDAKHQMGFTPVRTKANEHLVDCAKFVRNVQNILEEGNYKEALGLCYEGFSDTKARKIHDDYFASPWASAYGGAAWAKIAQTLYQIAVKWDELQALKEPGNKDEDKLDKEIQLMKDIVVSMNVFDGLAHNTGDVMPKLIDKELEKTPFNWSDGGEYIASPAKYKRNVLKLMDSKELEDPIEVYKEVEHIIGTTPYKNTFNDWIKRIVNHPGYNASTEEDRNAKIDLIRVRKEVKQQFSGICSYSLTLLNKAYEKEVAAGPKTFSIGTDNIKHYAKNISYSVDSMFAHDAMRKASVLAHNGTFNEEQYNTITAGLRKLQDYGRTFLDGVGRGQSDKAMHEQAMKILPEKLQSMKHIVETIENAIGAL
jgi:hypothetical protein